MGGVCVCPWLIYGSAGVDCDSHSLNCSLPRSHALSSAPPRCHRQQNKRTAVTAALPPPRTITKSDIALFECAESQRTNGDIPNPIFLSPKFAPAARASGVLGSRKPIERESYFWWNKGSGVHRSFSFESVCARAELTNALSEGSSHLLRTMRTD